MRHLLSIILITISFVSISQTISLQGVLRDENRRAVDDGFHDVTFKIYNEAGTQIWSDNYPNLETKHGVFKVNLGEDQSISGLAFDETYSVGITVAGFAEMTPRMTLSTYPYALAINGNNNKFPSNGNVEIRQDSLLMDNASFLIKQGDVVLNEGELRLEGGNGRIVFNDGTSLNTAEFGGPAGAVNNPSGTTINVNAGNAAGTGDLQFQSNSATVATITENGSMMLGSNNTSPDGRLDVRGDEVRIWDGTADVNDAVGSGDLYVEHDLEVDGDIYTSSQILIGTGDNSTTSPEGALDVRNNEVRVWGGTGNVNIGTGSGDLYVQSDLEADGILYVGTSAIIGAGTNTTTAPEVAVDVRGTGGVRVWDGTATVNDATGAGELYVEIDVEVDNDLYVADAVLIGDGTNSSTTASGHLDVRGDEVRIWDGTATVSVVDGTGDLYVENELEVDGTANFGAGSTSQDAIVNIYSQTSSVPGLYMNGSTRDITWDDGDNFTMGEWDGTSFDEHVRINTNGFVGIGESSPEAMLHVSSSTALTYDVPNPHMYMNQATNDWTLRSPSHDYSAISAIFENDIFVEDAVVMTGTQSYSDARIKKDISLSNSQEDLETLNSINIKNYKLIDTIGHGNTPYKKVIAQELKEVYPLSVSQMEKAIPSIYDKATEVLYKDGKATITMAKPHELVLGNEIKLYSGPTEIRRAEVVGILSETVFVIAHDQEINSAFVFGKWVDDFHSVDYDAISMLNVSATQELHKIIQKQQKMIELLQKEKFALKAELDRTKIATEKRLSRLEKLLLSGENEEKEEISERD